MGGRAFNNLGIESKRIDSLEYFNLQSNILNLTKDIFGNIHTVQSFYNKRDHGDIDFLITKPINSNWKDDIKELLRASHIYKNNKNVSYLVNGFQIDFSLIDFQDWNTAIFYYDFDPMGNLLGRIARFMGCSFGHKGLFYKVFIDNQYYNNICLSKEPLCICKFFGLSYQSYFNGHQDLYDIFDFIIESKYFSCSCFSLENLDHSTRTRNKKRKYYVDFLKYIEKYFSHKNSRILEEMKDNREKQIEFLEDKFPNIELARKIKKLECKHKKDQKLKLKWRSVDIPKMTGMNGKELGVVINDFKSSFLDWNYFLETSDKQQIKESFILWWSEYGKH